MPLKKSSDVWAERVAEMLDDAVGAEAEKVIAEAMADLNDTGHIAPEKAVQLWCRIWALRRVPKQLKAAGRRAGSELAG